MGKEIWADINGYEGLYQVSSFGRVKSSPRKVSSKGNSVRMVRERFLNNGVHRDGYIKVSLSKNNIVKTLQLHRIVASSFIENIENKPQVNHKNGDKQDNRVENLEWMTAKENQNHSRKYLNGNHSKPPIMVGGDHPEAKSVWQITKGGERIKKWDSLSCAAKDIGILVTGISAAAKGRAKTCGGFKWEYA